MQKIASKVTAQMIPYLSFDHSNAVETTTTVTEDTSTIPDSQMNNISTTEIATLKAMSQEELVQYIVATYPTEVESKISAYSKADLLWLINEKNASK
jgi:hypothetical protein